MNEQHERDRLVVRDAVRTSLGDIFGPDNVDGYEDDPWRLGVSLDGHIVDVHIAGSEQQP